MTRIPLLTLSLSLVAAACSGDDAGPRAVAATMPAPVPAVTDASVAPEGEVAVLELDAIDGMPEEPSPPRKARIAELPGPSTRLPKCLAGGSCTFGKDAWVETREGFVTRWAVAEVDGKKKKESDLGALLGLVAAELKPLIEPGPVIALAPEGKLEGKASGPVWLLAARVHVESARPARLMTSANGAVKIALNGKVVHEEKGDQYLLLDHRTVPLDLIAGWNTIVVRLEKLSPYAVELAMRLRGLDGSPIEGAVWGLPENVASAGSVCAALETHLAARYQPGGWRLEARVSPHGSLPWPLPKTIALKSGGGGATTPFDLDRGAHELAADITEMAGPITLAVDDVVCANATLNVVPAKQRYATAKALIDGLDAAKLAPGERESLEYQAEDARRLLEVAALGEPPRRFEATLAHFEAHARAAAKGERPFEAPGLHVRAYRSPYDGSLQRYVVVIPKSYAKGDPTPLVMLAHGLEYTPEDMMRIALAKPTGPGDSLRSGAFYKWDPPEPPSGAILVAHDGYGNAGQRAPGEVDVRRVIDEMKAAYRIDPRRVSISGFSLGGSVAFWVPFHAPSVFSASAPMCGYPNILEYRSVKAATKKPWEPQLLDEDGVAPYAEGGKYLPLKMVHGSMDGPSRSELIHNRYKTLRYPSELDIPALGHNVWDKAFEDGTMLKWLAARRRPQVAPQPVVRAGRYRWAQNYWLRIDRFADEAQFGQLDGGFKGDRIQVTSRNVAAFSLLGAELGERANKPQAIVVDGKNLGEHTVGSELHLARSATGWALTPAIDRPPTAKRLGSEGPLGDAWFAPLIVVYGTQLTNEIEANRLAAERLSMHAPWIDLRVPVLADVEVQDADLIGKNVVLVGRPASNALTKRAEPALSAAGIRFGDNGLDIGGQHFQGADIGVSLILPSPFDPDRYLVLHAGLGPDGTLSSRYLPELSPDFVVYDSRMRAVFGDRILGPREVLMGGFFDAEWRLPGAPR